MRETEVGRNDYIALRECGNKCSTKTFCDIDHVMLFIFLYRLSDVLVSIETQDVLWISNRTFEHAFISKYLEILKS